MRICVYVGVCIRRITSQRSTRGDMGDGDGIECTFKLDQSLMEEADPESSRYASHAQRSFHRHFIYHVLPT